MKPASLLASSCHLRHDGALFKSNIAGRCAEASCLYALIYLHSGAVRGPRIVGLSLSNASASDSTFHQPVAGCSKYQFRNVETHALLSWPNIIMCIVFYRCTGFIRAAFWLRLTGFMLIYSILNNKTLLAILSASRLTVYCSHRTSSRIH